MATGNLSDYFSGVAAKRLSAVEADLARSHQHELNGVSKLREILGTPVGKQVYPTRFIYLTDDDDEPLIDDATMTWYDSRANHVSRTEWRLYFPDTTVSQVLAEGDTVVIARRPDDTLLVVVAEAESTIAAQVLWLFGLETTHPGYSVRSELETSQDRLGFASSVILENIGVVIEEVEESALDRMLTRFDGRFPSTDDFSAFTRSMVGEVDAVNDPDGTLIAWLEKELILFRTLEKHLLAGRLQAGFGADGGDVEAFLSFSLTVQNRRKSRAGLSFENHVHALLTMNSIRFQQNVVTENQSKPDFLFPSGAAYHDQTFDELWLTMLGVKSTCKDRWRQVLTEANRVARKHLLTLEPRISSRQTDEMRSHDLQLVLPASLHPTYTTDQQEWLLDVRELIDLVRRRELMSQAS